MNASLKKTESPKWDAAGYAAHSVVQQAWARELIAKLGLRGTEQILDVGCGDGKVTAEIARAIPNGSATGIDASAEMIAFAQKTFPKKQVPNLEFHVMDARNIKFDSPFDLVFSNAALHWVDDHQRFLAGAASVLNPGGRLVVSCGGKGNAQDVFVALLPELRSRRWREFFRKMPNPYFFYTPEEYRKWLVKAGFTSHTVRLAPKDAAYPGAEGFAAWLRTTWIPYVQRVPEHLREEFINAVTGRYIAKHPPDAENKVHVQMVRLEIEAAIS
ncbi:MAG TPA: methyltransferase domain-containing protein [Candidatus Sulfotelmatobacter sp.]|nr:methyltransferase domain-containing protein [Candidatus Sulfotelmatobacter sp.]